jgi:hypothetical protein
MGFWDDAEVISVYTRKQAIEDGVLVDLSAVAPDVCSQHFKYPVACTAAVWSIIDKAVQNKKHHNDLNGVVHDILWMSRKASWGINPDTRHFGVIIKGAGRQSKFALKIVVSPGDTPEPVLTVMMNDED